MARSKINNNFFVDDGNLGLYLRDISKYKPLATKEEFEIAVKIKQGCKKSLDLLVKSNLRFVVSVARNYQNQGMTLVDLINEGNLGLIKAASRFDEKKNFKFISYAVWWIRQAILQGLADHSRIVKVPLNRVATIHKVGKARIALEQKLRRLPNIREIAAEMDTTEEDVARALKIGSSHASLDAPISDGSTGSLMDLMNDNKMERPDDYSERKSITREVENILSNLNQREQDVISLYFGIGEDTNYTLEEIGLRLGITRERVRQIKDAALKKLKRSHKNNAMFF